MHQQFLLFHNFCDTVVMIYVMGVFIKGFAYLWGAQNLLGAQDL